MNSVDEEEQTERKRKSVDESASSRIRQTSLPIDEHSVGGLVRAAASEATQQMPKEKKETIEKSASMPPMQIKNHKPRVRPPTTKAIQVPFPPRTFPVTVLPPPTAHALPFPPFPAPFMIQQHHFNATGRMPHLVNIGRRLSPPEQQSRHQQEYTPPSTSSQGISPPFAATNPPHQSIDAQVRSRPSSTTSNVSQKQVITTSPTVCSRCMKPWKGHHSQRPQVCDDQKRSDGNEPYLSPTSEINHVALKI